MFELIQSSFPKHYLLKSITFSGIKIVPRLTNKLIYKVSVSCKNWILCSRKVSRERLSWLMIVWNCTKFMISSGSTRNSPLSPWRGTRMSLCGRQPGRADLKQKRNGSNARPRLAISWISILKNTTSYTTVILQLPDRSVLTACLNLTSLNISNSYLEENLNSMRNPDYRRTEIRLPRSISRGKKVLAIKRRGKMFRKW